MQALIQITDFAGQLRLDGCVIQMSRHGAWIDEKPEPRPADALLAQLRSGLSWKMALELVVVQSMLTIGQRANIILLRRTNSTEAMTFTAPMRPEP